MERPPKTREDLLAELIWKPIRGCPGRLVHEGLSDRSPEELVGLAPLPVRTTAVAPDPVVIAQLPTAASSPTAGGWPVPAHPGDA